MSGQPKWGREGPVHLDSDFWTEKIVETEHPHTPVGEAFGLSEKEVSERASLMAAAPETAAKRDRLKEVNAGLVEALTRLESNIGWRSIRGEDPDLYYCEFCGENHADSQLIPHHDECLVSVVRKALTGAGG